MALPTITPQPVGVMTGSRDPDGHLVFADEQLVAVLVRLEDAVHEDERGAGFLKWVSAHAMEHASGLWEPTRSSSVGAGADTRLSGTLCIDFGKLTTAQDA